MKYRTPAQLDRMGYNAGKLGVPLRLCPLGDRKNFICGWQRGAAKRAAMAAQNRFAAL